MTMPSSKKLPNFAKDPDKDCHYRRRQVAPNFSFEKKLWRRGVKFVVGVDEVGRGAWAGPVVAAACAFAPQTQNSKLKTQKDIIIDDSKKLKPRQRERAAEWIKKNAWAWDVSGIGVSTINKIGIGKATARAMRNSIKNLKRKKEKCKIFVLVDGFHIRYLPGGLDCQQAIIHGDQKSLSIAAASILAKVYRDKLTRRLSKKYPRYGWGKNKGYGTKRHQKAILRYGLTRYHRRQFVETWLAKKIS